MTVYNFEVKDWHCYFVGEAGVLVHNSDLATCKNTLDAGSAGETKRQYTDQELVDAAYAIHKAQYGDKWWGKVNPISVTQAQNGIVVVTKNNSVLGKKSIAKAREIFGGDVLIPSGRGKNYNNALYDVITPSPNHAEPRGILALLSSGIDTPYARQATTFKSCMACLGLQKGYNMNNLTDKINFGVGNR